MKLKTLKDLEFVDDDEHRYYVAGIELRQEAIKWIKHISKDCFKRMPEVKFIKGHLDVSEVTKALVRQETDIVAMWIKYFFNLEELK